MTSNSKSHADRSKPTPVSSDWHQQHAGGDIEPARSHDNSQDRSITPGTAMKAAMPFELFQSLMAASLRHRHFVGDDPATATALPELIDRATHAAVSHLTGGLSPASLAVAWSDWWLHLAFAPGKQMQLAHKAGRKWLRFQLHMMECLLANHSVPACIEPLPRDQRFKDDAWQTQPWSLYYQQFLLMQQWWHNATTDVPGVAKHHERIVEFTARQLLDIASPSNFVATNPTVLDTTLKEAGGNLLRGHQNLLHDIERRSGGHHPANETAYLPGRDVAITPGKVVMRNELAELIQYAPQTGTVEREPILIVPAWIMKYYILDLEAHNSLVNHLASQGFTVFTLSWRNPTDQDRDVSFDDYRRKGILAALEAIGAIVPNTSVHGVGYCLGGTLLAITAAAMDRSDDHRIQSLTLLAAQTDFTEPGELQLFIDESQVRFLEDLMWEQGFLNPRQMAGAFQMLRSRDLIWSRVVNEYLLGERQSPTALMAWNADGTRLPCAMHSEYLRRLFLGNEFAHGRFPINGRPVAVSDIQAPIFAVGTLTDHVAPWKSVYTINLLADTPVTFLLTTGGHNAGILSEPGHPRRSYPIATRRDGEPYIDPETWFEETPHHVGSWWHAWIKWLREHSTGQTQPPPLGNTEAGFQPLADAPGQYVHIR